MLTARRSEFRPNDTAIQSAINLSVSGDTILVAPVVYLQVFDIQGKAITLANDSGPEVTVIDGDVTRCAIPVIEAEER